MIGYKVLAHGHNPYLPHFPKLTEEDALIAMSLASPSLAWTQTLAWPHQCSCCLGPAETSIKIAKHNVIPSGNRMQIYETSWPIPYCNACKRFLDSKSTLIISLIVFGVTMLCGLATWIEAVTIRFDQGEIVYPISFLVLLLVITAILFVYGLVLRSLGRSARRNCSAKTMAVRYQGEDKFTHTFIFANKKYAQEFASANGTQIESEVPW